MNGRADIGSHDGPMSGTCGSGEGLGSILRDPWPDSTLWGSGTRETLESWSRTNAGYEWNGMMSVFHGRGMPSRSMWSFHGGFAGEVPASVIDDGSKSHPASDPTWGCFEKQEPSTADPASKKGDQPAFHMLAEIFGWNQKIRRT